MVDTATDDAGPLQTVDIVLGINTLVPAGEDSYMRLVTNFKA